MQKQPLNQDCIFCKIISGIIPSSKVFENETILAFLDVSPIKPGHTLIIPKGHYENLLDLPEQYYSELIKISQKIGKSIIESGLGTGFNLVQNNFPSAGQVVMHAHWHIIPRNDSDGLYCWAGNQYKDTNQMLEIANKLSSLIK
ncbi:HIT family protein [Desulfovibrio litoralis]|uniref:Histidine triad (HIT) family protein n=1 Tax=Desulfovibrio litoralis DSM 11393 TaxID=1121455 RepID=A0A1M7SDG0_9BACT|nr:HIT family protein [Desulfovibrio litoralis]SHN56494.1 histidine triad (HIT) family protein [Desulfovibrio litoralis DSM 11393]